MINNDNIPGGKPEPFEFKPVDGADRNDASLRTGQAGLSALSSWKAKNPLSPPSDWYFGEFKQSKYHGTGCLTRANGEYYCGEFKEGKYHGKGDLKCARWGKYVGMFKEGKSHGPGKITYSNGDTFEGEFEQGQFLKGKLTLARGDVYEGAFKGNKYHGMGRLIRPDKSEYSGEFLGGYFQGQGKFIYANGDIYEGEFENNFCQGQGKYTYLSSDGTIYEGEFKENQFHGQGRLTWRGNRYEQGNFVEGLREGKFLRKESSGEFFIIHYQANEPLSIALGNSLESAISHLSPFEVLSCLKGESDKTLWTSIVWKAAFMAAITENDHEALKLWIGQCPKSCKILPEKIIATAVVNIETEPRKAREILRKVEKSHGKSDLYARLIKQIESVEEKQKEQLQKPEEVMQAISPITKATTIESPKPETEKSVRPEKANEENDLAAQYIKARQKEEEARLKPLEPSFKFSKRKQKKTEEEFPEFIDFAQIAKQAEKTGKYTGPAFPDLTCPVEDTSAASAAAYPHPVKAAPLSSASGVILQRNGPIAATNQQGLITYANQGRIALQDISKNRQIDPKIRRNAMLYVTLRLCEAGSKIHGLEDLEGVRHTLRHYSEGVTLEELDKFVEHLPCFGLRPLSLPTLTRQEIKTDTANQLHILNILAKKVEGKPHNLSLDFTAEALKGCCFILGEYYSKNKGHAKSIPYFRRLIEMGNKIAHRIGDRFMLNFATYEDVAVPELLKLAAVVALSGNPIKVRDARKSNNEEFDTSPAAAAASFTPVVTPSFSSSSLPERQRRKPA